MKARTLVIGTAIMFGVAVLYFDRRATRAELAALQDALPKAKAQRAAKETEAVWLAPPPARAPAETPAMRPADTPAEPSKPAARDPVQQKPAETPIEQFALVHDTLEAAFTSQSRDGGWAMEARRTADATLSAGLPPKSALKSIDCRSTLCRIESIHDRYKDAKAFVNQLGTPERRPWNGAFYTGPISQDPRSGAVTFVTYLAREGVELPAIPDQSGDEQAVR